jgi:hypothetical protein
LPDNPSAAFFWAEEPDRTDMCGLGMRAAFTRDGPLWAHSLFVSRADGLALVQTVDNDPEHGDPARVVSPVYQEIRRHECVQDAGRCLLLTGTYFQHHFSAAFTLGIDPERPDSPVLDVDVADRCRVRVAAFAATYTVKLDSGALKDASPQAIIWDVLGPDTGRLELVAIAPGTLALAEAGRNATRVQVVAAITSGSSIQLLRYRLYVRRVTPAGGRFVTDTSPRIGDGR